MSHTSTTDLPGVFVGLATLDLLYRVVRVPEANEKLSASDQVVAAGGPATNAAVAYAYLGGRPTLVTGVGSHALGEAISGGLRGDGVLLHDCAPDRAEAPTVSSILVSGTGERAVVSVHAGDMWLAAPEELDSWVAQAKVVLIDGHHVDLAMSAVDSAVRHRVPVVLDGGSWKAVTPELLPRADVAVVSADFVPPDLRPGVDVLAYLLGRGVRFAAVTDGERPVRWASLDASGSLGVPSVDAVDTTAAGDMLHGSLAWHVARSGTSTDAMVSGLERAISFASRFCSAFGTRTLS